MAATVCRETTIPSSVAARPSRDLVTAAINSRGLPARRPSHRNSLAAAHAPADHNVYSTHPDWISYPARDRGVHVEQRSRFGRDRGRSRFAEWPNGPSAGRPGDPPGHRERVGAARCSEGAATVDRHSGPEGLVWGIEAVVQSVRKGIAFAAEAGLGRYGEIHRYPFGPHDIVIVWDADAVHSILRNEDRAWSAPMG